MHSDKTQRTSPSLLTGLEPASLVLDMNLQQDSRAGSTLGQQPHSESDDDDVANEQPSPSCAILRASSNLFSCKCCLHSKR